MKKLIYFISIGLICFLAFVIFSFEKTQNEISKSVVRLHVVANSDKSYDQNLKLKVRDRIIREFSDDFSSLNSQKDAKEFIENNIEKIKDAAIDEINKNGYDYDISVNLTKDNFPTKTYGDVTLPKGKYDALKVNIGLAKGKNWWCVLFPPLCFAESTVSFDDDSVSLVAGNVSKETSKLLDANKSHAVEIKFKAYEIWQTGKEKITAFFKN